MDAGLQFPQDIHHTLTILETVRLRFQVPAMPPTGSPAACLQHILQICLLTEARHEVAEVAQPET